MGTISVKILIFIVIMIVSKEADLKKTPKTKKGHFVLRLNNGTEVLRKCSHNCPKGREISRGCSSYSNIECSKCRTGTFSKHYSKHCRPCRRCGRGFYEYKPCTAFRNTKCRKIRRRCKRESFPGSRNSTKCYKDRNNIPSLREPVCTPGYFLSNVNGSDVCVPCTPCRPHEIVKRQCAGRQNSKCGKCKKGYFRLQSTNACARCSLCYGRVFHRSMSDVVVSECDRHVNKSSPYRCFPVLNFHALSTSTDLSVSVKTGTVLTPSDTVLTPSDNVSTPFESTDIDYALEYSNVRNETENEEVMIPTFYILITALCLVLLLLVVVLILVRRQYFTQRKKLRERRQQCLTTQTEKSNTLSFIMDRYMKSMDTVETPNVKYSSTCTLNIHLAVRGMEYTDSGFQAFTDGDQQCATSNCMYMCGTTRAKRKQIKIHKPITRRYPDPESIRQVLETDSERF